MKTTERERRWAFAEKHETLKKTARGYGYFMSYACPHCQRFSSSVWRLMRSHLVACKKEHA